MAEGKSKILVLVEGEKTDYRLMGHLLEVYGISDSHEIVSYNTNIYVLYNEMFRDGDPASMDILQILKEHERDLEKKKLFDERYSDILLIFDLDPQDPAFSADKIVEMASYFVESSDMGKLYLNYPIFTLNYDNNLEKLTKRPVFHLHGDFSVLANSENPNHVQGYIRSQKRDLAIVNGMEHCFCNALLNYSGELKYRTANEFYKLIMASENFKAQYENSPLFRQQMSDLKKNKPFEYQMIMTKIEHPELNIATEYHFEEFESISDELPIIGMSPNNDSHIFNLICNNKDLRKVVFYYFSDTEKRYIEEHFSKDVFTCYSVEGLWRSLGCNKPKYNCNYTIPTDIDKFIASVNILSGCKATKEEILTEISQIPQFEMERLCRLVKDDMHMRNPENRPTNKDEFLKSTASISYIALQEGILPSTLYLICIMNFHLLKGN